MTLLSTAVALVVAEGALVLLDLPAMRSELHIDAGDGFADLHTDPDPELLWRVRPGSYEVESPTGMRGWVPRGSAGEHRFRIACVGDSSTFGLWSRYEDTWGVRVERALQDLWPDRCVESVLCAAPGYSSFQSVALWRAEAAPLEPAITVAYLGGWNDFQNAIGAPDAERAARQSSSRLVELGRRWLDSRSSLSQEDYAAAFRRGESPAGVRVPLAEFEGNLTDLVADVRAAGGALVLVVPPLPSETVRAMPASLDYPAVVRRVAQSLGVAIVDAAALFEDRGEEALFVDRVHPSRRGHELLAAAVVEQIRDVCAPAEPRRPGSAAVGGVALWRCEPETIPALSARSVVVHGRGIASGGIERVWVGPRWVEQIDVLDDQRLHLTLRRGLPPGEHGIELVSGRGRQRTAAVLQVKGFEPPALEVRVADSTPERVRLHLRCQPPPQCMIAVWLAPGLSASPAETAFGPFWLSGTSSAPALAPGAGFGDYRRLAWPRAMAISGRGGFDAVLEVSPSSLSADGTAHLQGLVVDLFDPTIGTVTARLRVDTR